MKPVTIFVGVWQILKWLIGRGEKERDRENLREADDKQGLADALGNMGLIYRSRGEPDKALAHYRQALAIHREIGYRQGEANQLGNILRLKEGEQEDRLA